ncbi:MAG: putative glycoside hydrolase [Lachnospiraceae bacterium]|nr:putative glycoside hydrolase [Lachnospiraceae bacterium]
MTTRREWLRQQRRRKYGKYRGPFIALGILAGLAALGGLVFLAWRFVILRLPHGEKEPEVKELFIASENSVSEAEAVSDNEAETEQELFSKAEWKKEHDPVKGIYVTGPVAGSERMEELVTLLDSTELNAMVIDVKNDAGEVTFQLPEEMKAAQMGNCVRYIRDPEEMLAGLKEHGIITIARIVCFKDPLLAEAAPELALLDAAGNPVTDGKDLAWVNPCSREVWDYLIELACYSADLGFDEIQFDYVRFPVGAGTEDASYGTELTEENKHEFITDFLSDAAAAVHDKKVPLTADLFGTVIGNPTDVGKVGQDYVELASAVDALCPMIYPSHYGNGVFGLDVPDAAPHDTVLAALTLSSTELSEIPEDECAVVRPWLQDFTATWVNGHISYGEEQVREQIRAVEEAGYREWILWNARNHYSLTE